ncbi:MAG: UDP-D-galactose:(glucosyl)lipopolysaccharide-1,6-D-galactosyltransferase [Methanocella sp. PtaU1.Bin125]|nr:MAG: UDP-D-galactose:(glucosyl)lipopolysaccharide-1,6-D-galactosyltransferase [Methanocella sp. PtaU1.Bin125]
MIGDGPERASLEALAADLKVPVTFTGFLEEDALIGRLKAAKVFVLPSTREGFSITTLEAMACGLPVLTVDAPGNAAGDLVKDGAGGCVVPLDDRALREAINGLLSDDPGRRRMADRCAADAEKYDWGRLVPALEAAYRR